MWHRAGDRLRGDDVRERAGHDAWIVGEETLVGVEFSSEIEHFAKEEE
jgi:hypothetical protein